MLKIVLFFGLFVVVMVYRMVVIYKNRGVSMPEKTKKAKDDQNIIYDPTKLWHPLNYFKD